MTRVFFAAALAIALLAAGPVRADDPVVIKNCIISLIDEALAPAKEPGVLVAIKVQEGDRVTQGQILAEIDDAQPQVLRRSAVKELAIARKQAESDVNVRYAKAAYAVARVELLKALEANSKAPGVYPEMEIKKLELTKDRAALQIEQAQMEQIVAKMAAEAKAVEVEAADVAIARRQVTSPIDGVVVERLRKPGEWVSPGQPIVRVVRLERLKVEGFVEASRHEPLDLLGQPIRIEVQATDQRIRTVEARITYASPVVDASRDFRFVAEFDNPLHGKHYTVRPGLTATVTFQQSSAMAAK